MRNQQLIKSAQIWFVAVLLACGLVAMAANARITIVGQQNSNQNSNSNSSNENKAQNSNANNTNSGASGERTAMGAMNSKDRDFVVEAAMGGMMEVELGRWATQKSTNDAVKQFGRRMADDHAKANTELMSLAASKGITLPTELDAKHRAEITKLLRLSGEEFDRAYSKLMLSDHTKDVAAFEKQSTKGADPDIKAFATSTLPTLQEHLTLAKALPGNEKTNSNMNSNSNSNMNSNSNTRPSKNKNANNNGNDNSNRP